MKRTVLGILAAVVIGGGYTAYDFFTGNEFGGACAWNTDCKGSLFGKMGNQCLDLGSGGFCTSTCTADADCPQGYTCQEFDYYEDNVPKGKNQVCAPAAAPQPEAAPGQVPQPVPQPAPVQ